MTQSITVSVDTVAQAAYIKLSSNPVARTVDFDDVILVDLDEFGVAVGIDILDENAELPFAELTNDFHVHSDVIDLLRLIRPSVPAFLEFHQVSEGASSTRAATDLVPA